MSYLYGEPYRTLPPRGVEAWLTAFLHMLSFIPVGFLIVFTRRPPVRPVPAALFAAALAVVLTAGKFLFYGRHAAAADIVAQPAGGLLGAALAWRLTHVKHSTSRQLMVDGIARLEG